MAEGRSARRRGTPAARPPAVDYRFVADRARLDQLIEELAVEDRYGLDTEFHRERTYYPRLALLQVAWGRQVAIVDPLAVDLAPFARVLAGPGLAIVHASDQDLEVLERACGQVPERLFDTQLAAGFDGLSTPSLGTLVERVLGLRLEKGDQLTDWTRRPLDERQLAYAASDVAYLLELHQLLVERLEKLGRLAWAEEECSALLARARGPVEPEEAWWRLKHARQLRGRERQVAQVVAAWRERRAQRLDVPTRYVLSDLALVSIAHRPPNDRAALEAVRGIDVRNLGGALNELLAAVKEGLALSPGAMRLPPDPPAETVARPAASLGAAWVGSRARQLGIDTTLLATRADLAAFFKARPEGRLTLSWRHELVGDPLRKLAEGSLALAVGRRGDLVLEERSHRPAAPEVPTPADEIEPAGESGEPAGESDESDETDEPDEAGRTGVAGDDDAGGEEAGAQD